MKLILLLALVGILALAAGCTNSIVSGPSSSPQSTPESSSKVVWQSGLTNIRVFPICEDYTICYGITDGNGISGFSCFYGAEEPALFRKYCPVQV